MENYRIAERQGVFYIEIENITPSTKWLWFGEEEKRE